MSRIRRKGLRREPPDGWLLDRLFVGVATLRTLRELYRHHRECPGPVRAWDLSLWSGVTSQGSADSLMRASRTGLVEIFPSGRAGYAPTFVLDDEHPLYDPLALLFEVERIDCLRPPTPATRGSRRARGARAPRG